MWVERVKMGATRGKEEIGNRISARVGPGQSFCRRINHSMIILDLGLLLPIIIISIIMIIFTLANHQLGLALRSKGQHIDTLKGEEKEEMVPPSPTVFSSFGSLEDRMGPGLDRTPYRLIGVSQPSHGAVSFHSFEPLRLGRCPCTRIGRSTS